MECTGPPWWPPEVANHEALEQRRLSTSEYNSAKGQQGSLGSLSYGRKGGPRIRARRGVSNGRWKWIEK